MTELRLLTVSDLGVSTGFSRVMNEVIDYFPEYIDVHSLAINYFGDPHTVKSKLYPASAGGDLYGINRIDDLIEKLKPDRIFILQDSWIIKEYLNRIPEERLKDVVIYTPVDAEPYMYQWLEKFSLVKHVCVYTEFGKRVLTEANPDIKNISVVPHGINTKMFYPMDVKIAREKLADLPLDAFIILNVNRNQPRKRIDMCAKAFGIFARDKPDVRYYHHAGLEDVGWNIVALSKRHGFEKRLILSSKDLSPRRAVSNETLNIIYNACDVGLNLSTGEGWGLCFKGNTDVLTTRGFKQIKNVNIGDQVFDVYGAVTTVTNTLSRKLDNSLYKVKISGLSDFIYVTEEHPFFTNKGFVKAKDLTVNSYVLKPDIENISLFSKIDLTHYAPLIHDENYIYFNNAKKKFGLKVSSSELKKVKRLFNANVKLTSLRKINRYINLDESILPILFYFLSSKGRVKHFAYSEELLKLFEELFNYTGKRYFDNTIRLTANLTLALERIAKSQLTYLTLSRKLTKDLLYKLIDKKGYTHPTTKSLFLASYYKEKARIYRLLLLKLGIASSEYKIKDGTTYISIDKKHLPEFLASNSNRNRIETIEGYYYRITSVEKVPFKGMVYNLETESHTYNVFGYAVHNCNMEHAVTGKPQIISANSANLENYIDDRGILVPISHYDTNPKILTEGAVPSLEHAVAAMEYTYKNRDACEEIGNNAREYFLQDKFKWSNISNTFREIIES